MTNQVIFCVAGMHRSGSSLFANWLQNCNIFIGYELLGKASSNKYGHFEDLDFLQLHINELIVNNLNESGLYGDLSKVRVSKSFDIEARKLIDNRSDKPVWAWKEPRTTLFLENWKAIIPNLKVIVVRREEPKIVDSLYSRLKKNKWYFTRNPVKKFLWYLDIDLRPSKWQRIFHQTCKVYELALKTFSDRHSSDVLTVDLSEFIEDHSNQVERINQFLGLQLPVNQLDSVFDRNILNL